MRPTFTMRASGFALVLGMIFTTSACGGSGEEDETSVANSSGGGELTLYQARSPEGIGPVIEAFEAYYLDRTGAEVTVASFNQSGGDLRATLDLEARGDAVEADVVLMDIGEVLSLTQSYPDLFAADFDPANLADEAVSAVAREASQRSPGTMVSLQPYVIGYNTELVSAAEVPQSWTDLLDDRWANQLGMGDPETTSGAHVPLWFLTDYMADEVGSPFGWEYYEQLAELDPRLESSHSAVIEFLAAGELQVGVLGYGTVLASALDGNPVAAVLPEEGTSGLVGTVAVVADSPEREIAEIFVEWLVSLEGQQVLYQGSGTVAIRSDIEVDEIPFEFDTTSDKIVPLDAQWVAENRAENIEMFGERMD